MIHIVLECCPSGTLPFHLYFNGLRTKYFIISRHPQDMGLKNNRLLDPYDRLSWTAIILSIGFLTIMILITVKVYNKISFRNSLARLDFNFLFLRYAFGITEPDRVQIVTAFSLTSGKKYNMSSFYILYFLINFI